MTRDLIRPSSSIAKVHQFGLEMNSPDFPIRDVIEQFYYVGIGNELDRINVSKQ
jgi:hypothetical protein